MLVLSPRDVNGHWVVHPSREQCLPHPVTSTSRPSRVASHGLTPGVGDPRNRVEHIVVGGELLILDATRQIRFAYRYEESLVDVAGSVHA
jgi:hypothetical protein